MYGQKGTREVFVCFKFLFLCSKLQEQREDIWKDGEMSEIGVYDVKFTQNQ